MQDARGVNALPSGVVTFLFTDLEGSTGKWEKHPEAMRDSLARHDAILRRAVEAHAGHVVKSTGDGVHAVFAAAPDAVLAARDAVEAFSAQTWDTTGPLRVRVGMHTGRADERDGDYFGLTLNRASRLMACAHGGQVVLSEVTAERVRSALSDDLALVDLGHHRLRGLERAEHVFELRIAGFSPEFPPLQSLEAFPSALTLPEPAFAAGDEGLADRRDELAALERAWQLARDGARRIALVGGEPGIGKTRLAGALAHRAYAQGSAVLYGRCDEEAIVPYQPFVEALRPCIGAYTTATLHERLHGLEHDVARVFPELSRRLTAPATLVSGDPEADRYRFFEAITTVLTGVTATRTTVLVLDDLQWADKPTLLLLRHIVRAAARVPLVVVVCYRDVEPRRDNELTDLLADLRREPFVTRVRLEGLQLADIAELVRARSGRAIGEPLLAALHRESGGNPFFVEELVRHLVDTDALREVSPPVAAGTALDPLDLPESVRDVIGRRLRALPDDVNDVLTLAAVIGRVFDVALLGSVARESIDRVLDALDRAADAGIVREDPAHVGRYSFSHALVRQTLNAELGTAARARLHARVGTALEGSPGHHRAAEIAFHFTRAVPLVGADKAIAYTTRAGHDSLADLAFEDAVVHFERALQLLDQFDAGEVDQRVEVMTDLASALVYVDERAGVETALRAVDTARTKGCAPSQFGRAVAVAVEPVHGVLAYPNEVTALFDEARSVLGDGDPALRARLLAFEAFKYATHMLHGRAGRVLAEEAIALAQRSDDPVTLADALYASAVSLEGSPDLARRVALGEDLLALGDAAGARAIAFGLRVIAGVQLEAGDAAALTDTIDTLGRRGRELRWLPAQAYTAQLRAAQALLEGRFEAVRAHGEELQRFARAYRGAAGMHFMQSTYLAREENARPRRPPAAPIDATPDYDLYTRATLALAHLDAGDEGTARFALDSLDADDFPNRARESGWGSALGMFAEVIASVGAPEHAALLSELLQPFSGQLLAAVLGLACLGAADRYIGILETMRAQWDAADEHFARALATEEGLRGRALLPRTRYWQARSLAARSDERGATALLDQVIEETTALGMERLRAEAAAARGG